MTTPVTFKQNGYLYKPTLIKKTQIDQMKNGALPVDTLGLWDKFWDKLCSLFNVDTDTKKAAVIFKRILDNHRALTQDSSLTPEKTLTTQIITDCNWLKDQIAPENYREFQQTMNELMGKNIFIKITLGADQKEQITEITYNIVEVQKRPRSDSLAYDDLDDLIDKGPDYGDRLSEISPRLQEFLDLSDDDVDQLASIDNGTRNQIHSTLRSRIETCFPPEKFEDIAEQISKLSESSGIGQGKIADSKIKVVSELLKLARGGTEGNFQIEVTAEEGLRKGRVRVGFKLFGISLAKIKCDATAIDKSFREYQELLLLREYFEPEKCVQALELFTQISDGESAGSNVDSFYQLVKMVKPGREREFQLSAIVGDDQTERIKITLPYKTLICEDSEDGRVAACVSCLTLFSPDVHAAAWGMIKSINNQEPMEDNISNINELIKLAEKYSDENFKIVVTDNNDQRKTGKVQVDISIAGKFFASKKCDVTEVAGRLADYQSLSWIKSFTPKNSSTASQIINNISSRKPMSANIRNISALVAMAKVGAGRNFQVPVTATEDQIKRGKVQVGIKLFNKLLFDAECDATEVAGSLMGYEKADPTRIAREMNLHEKVLLARVLVKLNDLESVTQGRDKDQYKESFNNEIGDVCYENYRPGEERVAILDTRRYPVASGGANKFDDSVHYKMEGLSPADENVFSIFANIGYEKIKDRDIVKFYKVHPLLQGILSDPRTDLQTILDLKPDGAEALKSYREINSEKFNQSDLFYREFLTNQKSLQPFLLDIFDNHQTLNIVYAGQSRNFPIAPKKQRDRLDNLKIT